MAGRDAKAQDKQAQALRLAIEAARIARDRNCREILVLDLRELSPVTDYFVIATGTSGRQMSAVTEEIRQNARAMGHKAFRTAGAESADWILIDFVDVVVHLFDEEHRRYYDLELIWGEAPRVDWQGESPPGAA